MGIQKNKDKCKCGRDKCKCSKSCQKCYLKSDRSKCHNRKGENNLAWKGNSVGYKGLHLWVRKNKPMPKCCKKCHKNNLKLQISNISGEYKRDIEDYEWLCQSCHAKKDRIGFKDRKRLATTHPRYKHERVGR